MTPSPYHRTQVDADGEDSLALILALVTPHTRVLDLGCSTGALGGPLRERGCVVTGVDLDVRDLAEASARLDAVHRVDLDREDLRSVLAGQLYDVVIAADVLEHLRSPERVLEQLRGLLAPEGCLVFSIPNVAHASVRLALWQGDFPYDDTGLLDRTHVRMYTRRGVEELLTSSGFRVTRWQRTVAKANQGVPFQVNGVPRRALVRMLRSPDADTFQFVGRAVPIRPASPVVDKPPVTAGDELLRAQAAAIAARDERIRDLEARLPSAIDVKAEAKSPLTRGRKKARRVLHSLWQRSRGLGG